MNVKYLYKGQVSTCHKKIVVVQLSYLKNSD